MLRALAGGCLVAAMFAFAACGGGSSSADYDAGLDDACADLQAENLKLPQIQADEELTNEEVQQRAQENVDDFIAKVEALDPPDDLADLQDDLLAKVGGDAPQDPDGFLDYLDGLAGTYDDLGATGCAAGVRESADRFQEDQAAFGDDATAP